MKIAARIFISYARSDRERVEILYQKLSEAGFKPWMDTKDILPGEDWELGIQKAIQGSDFFLACLSKKSVIKRGIFQKEIKEALDIWQQMLGSDIYLIPVRLDDCLVPDIMRKFQYVDLFHNSGFPLLKQTLQIGMKRRGADITVFSQASPSSKTQVVLTFNNDVSQFDEQYKIFLRNALALFLGISFQDIEIKSVDKGSVKVAIELPTESGEKLLSAHKSKDPELAKWFDPLVLLEINFVTDLIKEKREGRTPMISEFIGRQEELKKFETALDTFAEDKPHIAFVYDAAEKVKDKGGIGKTRLLHEFLRITKLPKYQNKFLVIDEVFDFYEPVNRDRLSRISRFVRLLEEKNQTKAFDRFWKNIREYYAKNVSMEKVLNEYFGGYNEFCQEVGKKIIRFFDTFEVAEKTLNYLQPPYRFIDDQVLLNSFVVISGRNKPNLTAQIWEGRESQILEFPLKGFSDEEAQNYFINAGYQDLLPQYIIELNKKARGRPILLALIVDYLNNILEVEEILKLEEKDFKERLVAFINDFDNPPIGQAILAMAHLKHRCNAKFLRQFVKPDEKFDKDFEVLKSLSFVRPLGARGEYIVLHDEMQKMVSAFILEKVYGDGSLRREISEQAITFYDEEIRRLREQEAEFIKQNDVSSRQVVRDERFILTAEQWYHRLYVSQAEVIDYYFFELYDPSLEEGHLDYCFVLQSHLDDLTELLELPIRAKNRIKLRAARLNTEKFQVTINQYYYDEAKKLFEELIEGAKKRGEKAYLGVLLCDYGTLQFYSRELVDAEKLLRDSVKVLEEEITKINHDLFYFQGKSKNWLGYILYNQGRFKVSIKILEEAEKHLSEADTLIKNDPEIADTLKQLRRKQIDAWLAQVRGNLCRIYREVGDTEKSIYYGESSLFRRRKLANLKEIVKGLNSLGLIYSRKGEVVKALELFKEAEGYLQNVPDPILEGRVLTNKATLLFKRDQFSELLARHTRRTLPAAIPALAVDQASIREARELLNHVIQSLIRTNVRELATAYYNLGELCLMEEKYVESLENFEYSVKVSQTGEDTYTLMNSRQRLILAAYLRNDTNLFHELVQRFSAAQKELQDPEETARYIIRYYITFGNFYYDRLVNGERIQNFAGNFGTAFRSYTDAIVYARSHAEGSVRLVQEVFAARLLELLKGKEISQNLRNELLSDWQKRRLDTVELQRYLDF